MVPSILSLEMLYACAMLYSRVPALVHPIPKEYLPTLSDRRVPSVSWSTIIDFSGSAFPKTGDNVVI